MDAYWLEQAVNRRFSAAVLRKVEVGEESATIELRRGARAVKVTGAEGAWRVQGVASARGAPLGYDPVVRRIDEALLLAKELLDEAMSSGSGTQQPRRATRPGQPPGQSPGQSSGQSSGQPPGQPPWARPERWQGRGRGR